VRRHTTTRSHNKKEEEEEEEEDLSRERKQVLFSLFLLSTIPSSSCLSFYFGFPPHLSLQN